MNKITIRRAVTQDAQVIAPMIEALLREISERAQKVVEAFDTRCAIEQLQGFIQNEQNIVFCAYDEGAIVGVMTLYPSFAVYAGGAFGTIAELYVKVPYRSLGVGQQLMDTAKVYAKEVGWARLEVTTPPLPSFDGSFAFYEREGFSISGGRKMRFMIHLSSLV